MEELKCPTFILSADNTLRRMVEENAYVPFPLSCPTNQAKGHIIPNFERVYTQNFKINESLEWQTSRGDWKMLGDAREDDG